MPPDPTSPLFPYTTLFRSVHPPICIDMTKTMTKMASMMLKKDQKIFVDFSGVIFFKMTLRTIRKQAVTILIIRKYTRSEEHTSELQSRGHLVCRLLLEKKK